MALVASLLLVVLPALEGRYGWENDAVEGVSNRGERRHEPTDSTGEIGEAALKRVEMVGRVA